MRNSALATGEGLEAAGQRVLEPGLGAGRGAGASVKRRAAHSALLDDTTWLTAESVLAGAVRAARTARRGADDSVVRKHAMFP